MEQDFKRTLHYLWNTISNEHYTIYGTQFQTDITLFMEQNFKRTKHYLWKYLELHLCNFISRFPQHRSIQMTRHDFISFAANIEIL